MLSSIVIATLLAATGGAGTTIHVDVTNCPGPGDGSIENPYCSVQAALDGAANGDEVLAAPGTYVENIDFLGKAVALRSTGGPVVTVLDGSAPGPQAVPVTVSFRSCEGRDSVIEGFTITGAENFTYSGGGISCRDGSPTITHCVISGNMAEAGGGIGSLEGSPVIDDCLITGNTSYGGVGHSRPRR